MEEHATSRGYERAPSKIEVVAVLSLNFHFLRSPLPPARIRKKTEGRSLRLFVPLSNPFHSTITFFSQYITAKSDVHDDNIILSAGRKDGRRKEGGILTALRFFALPSSPDRQAGRQAPFPPLPPFSPSCLSIHNHYDVCGLLPGLPSPTSSC